MADFKSESDWDLLLLYVTEALQLSPSQHAAAEAAYRKVADYVAHEEGPFTSWGPDVYPQGSMAVGTTVKPTKQNEFDLDLVFELRRDHRTVAPMRLLDAAFAYIKQHGEFGPIAERKDRCVRLSFAGDFHLDVVPSCVDLARAPWGIQVPDRDLCGWKPSSPKATAAWFRGRTALRRQLTGMLGKQAHIEPVPPYQRGAAKSPLQATVQLLKRHRDLHFASMPELCTPSILINTLSGERYDGEPGLLRAFVNTVEALGEFAAKGSTAPRIVNPADPAEVISEKWESDPRAWTGFQEWIDALRALIRALDEPRPEVLTKLFGEAPVHEALKRQAADAARARDEGSLRVTGARNGAGALATGGAAVSGSQIVRPHTFHGDR